MTVSVHRSAGLLCPLKGDDDNRSFVLLPCCDTNVQPACIAVDLGQKCVLRHLVGLLSGQLLFASDPGQPFRMPAVQCTLGQVPALQSCSSNLLAALENTPLLPSLESMLRSVHVTPRSATNLNFASTVQKTVTVHALHSRIFCTMRSLPAICYLACCKDKMT